MTDRQDGTEFKYSAEEWSAVVSTIPAAMAANADLVRQKLEGALSGYLTLTRRHSTRFEKGSPARRMLQAHDQIKLAIDYADKTGNAPLKDSLEAALKVMHETTQVEALDMLRHGHKGRTDPARDLLYHLLLTVWTSELTGTLTTGRTSGASPGKREANSPAIRFLIATLKPLIPIGPEAAKKIVEAEKRGRAALQKQIAARQEQQEPATVVANDSEPPVVT